MMIFSLDKLLRQGLWFVLLSALTAAAWADSSDVIQPIPETGAFSASFREDRGAITVIDFAGNYDKDINGLPNFEPRAVVAREFLRTHTDEYDFLVVFSTFEFETLGAQAFHLRLQNQVQGIGIAQYDNSPAFGSNGRLLGYTDTAALSRYVTNPLDPEFEQALATLGHETLHQWSGNARFDQGAGPETALIGRDDAHWSNLLDSEGSVLYGHKWRNNGDGTFTSAANSRFFSPLDLYLAGFYDAAEVPPMTLLVNPDVDQRLTPPQSLVRYGPTISATSRQISIDDIIAAEGPRIPSAAQSRKHFRFGFILLAGANEPVSQSQLGAIDRVRRGFVDRFSVWTGGRATANAYPQTPAGAQAGLPDVVVGGEPRVDSADVLQAFSWLRAQQDSTGFWRDKETTTLRDTVVVTDILARFDASFVRENDALDWLAEVEIANTDYLARQASLLQELGRGSSAATLRDRLLTQQNADGGWGIDTAFASNALDTALAVLALHGQAEAPAPAMARALDYLRGQQNADGGWGNRAGSPSRTSVTTTVI